jgi:hypothetical protein
MLAPFGDQAIWSAAPLSNVRTAGEVPSERMFTPVPSTKAKSDPSGDVLIAPNSPDVAEYSFVCADPSTGICIIDPSRAP